MAPEKLIKRLAKKDLTINRAALTTLEEMSVLSKKTLTNVALKVIKSYKRRFKAEIQDGESKTGALATATNDDALLIARVQNTVIQEVAAEINDQYRGEFYEWLPSDAETPDAIHQLNYGKTFQIGAGEQPGDRYGCRCGMNILVNETRLNL